MADDDSKTCAEPATSRRPPGVLGRKGVETRLRLMDAARELLSSTSAVSLTVTAIARTAKTSSATFYVYFDDVVDVVLALAAEASDDLDAVIDALDGWRAGLSPREGATAFVTAFRAYYARHRPIFAIRNMEADRGDQRFLDIRARAGEKMLSRLARLMADGHHDGRASTLDAREAMARASVIYSAIERLAASEDLYRNRRAVDSRHIVEAQISILAGLASPEG